MLGRKRDEYLALGRRFTPTIIKLIVVAESPPVSGRYFYDPAGALGEPLFSAMMKHHGLSPGTKESGLRAFQQRGWLLVDATYKTANTLSAVDRDHVIAEDYRLLREDLDALLPDRSTPLLLIKANVCQVLEPKLSSDGFKVINRGCRIYFPSTGQQGKFHQQVQSVLGSSGIR